MDIRTMLEILCETQVGVDAEVVVAVRHGEHLPNQGKETVPASRSKKKKQIWCRKPPRRSLLGIGRRSTDGHTSHDH